MKSVKFLSILAVLSISAGASANTFLLAGRGKSMSDIFAKRYSIENLNLKISHAEEDCAEEGKRFEVLDLRDSTRSRVGGTYIYTTLAKVECE